MPDGFCPCDECPCAFITTCAARCPCDICPQGGDMGYNESYYGLEPCARCGCVCGACDDDGCLAVVCVCWDDEPHTGWARFFCDSIPSAQGQGVQVLRGVADGGFDGRIPRIEQGSGNKGVAAQRGGAKFHDDIPMVGCKVNVGRGVAAQRGKAEIAPEAKFHEGRPVIWGKQTGGQGAQANRGGESAKFDERIPSISAKANSGKGVAAHRGDAKFDERRPYVLTRHSGGQGVTAQMGWDGEAE